MPTAEVDHIRSRFEAFVEELEREYYREGAGLTQEIRAAEIYERYRDLSTLELVASLRGLLASHPAAKHLRWLLEATVGSYLGNRTRSLGDELLRAEASGTITLRDPDETMPFRASAAALVNEKNRDRRRAISSERDRFVETVLNPLHVRIHRETWEGVRALGLPSYRSMVEEFSRMPLGALQETTGRFLAATDDMYGEVLSFYATRRLGLPAGDLEKHDLAYLGRASDFDRLFPREDMVPTVLTFVRRMGLDPSADGRIHLDLEPRPTKSPRAFCSAVRVPHEVYLVIRPSGGVDDYRSFLHELGHALHFGYTDPSLAWEERALGDNSVTETYAMLFDHLLHNPVWLRKVAGVMDTAPLVQHASFLELMMLRRYSAKLAYELELHASESLGGRAELYRDLLSGATKVRYTTAHYLADVDPLFYCARYLRAWMLQAEAAALLTERFDEDWFVNPRAGAYLKELWMKGQGLSAEELSGQFGASRLTMDRLQRTIEHALGS